MRKLTTGYRSRLRIAIALLFPLITIGCTPNSEVTDLEATDLEATDSVSSEAASAEQIGQSEPAETSSESVSNATSESFASEPAADSNLRTGDYCYEKEQGDVHTYARLRVFPDDAVIGSIQHDFPPMGGDVSSVRIDARGTVENETLDLSIRRFSEYDGGFASTFRPGPDPEPAVWQATSQTLSIDSETQKSIGTEEITKSDCTRVNAAMKRMAGDNSSTYTDGYDNIERETVQFEPGTSGTTVSGSLVRREANLYLVSAQEGQTMAPIAASEGNNAVFQVLSPSGVMLIREDMETELALPETGTYEIVVAGSRGNASYDLTITIQ